MAASGTSEEVIVTLAAESAIVVGMAVAAVAQAIAVAIATGLIIQGI